MPGYVQIRSRMKLLLSAQYEPPRWTAEDGELQPPRGMKRLRVSASEGITREILPYEIIKTSLLDISLLYHQSIVCYMVVNGLHALQ